MDNKILEEMLAGEQEIQRGAPCSVAVQGTTYKVKQISNTIRRKISDLEKEVLVLEKESKKQDCGILSSRQLGFVCAFPMGDKVETA